MSKKVVIKAWVAREESGILFISKRKPERQSDNTWDSWDMDWICLGKGSLPNLGITWNDEPKKCKITISIEEYE